MENVYYSLLSPTSMIFFVNIVLLILFRTPYQVVSLFIHLIKHLFLSTLITYELLVHKSELLGIFLCRCFSFVLLHLLSTISTIFGFHGCWIPLMGSSNQTSKGWRVVIPLTAACRASEAWLWRQPSPYSPYLSGFWKQLSLLSFHEGL